MSSQHPPHRSAAGVHGVLVVDKPYGMTSAEVVALVKRRYKAARVGHTGTLDPLATGVLPICLGEATKIAGYLLADDKRYEAGLCLGEATPTYDRESAVHLRDEVRARALTLADIEKVLCGFRGEIAQQPPQHSAIKVDGKPLYERARAGEVIDVPARHVVIRSLEIKRWSYPYLDLEVACSKGTYIRSLAHDIGLALGCYAHLYALRRTHSGAIGLATAVTVSALDPKALALPTIMPIEASLAWPVVEVSGPMVAAVRQGKIVEIDAVSWRRGGELASQAGGGMCLVMGDGQLIALCEIELNSLRVQRGFVEGLTMAANSFMVPPLRP